jgi:hypothetical protein
MSCLTGEIGPESVFPSPVCTWKGEIASYESHLSVFEYNQSIMDR